MTIKFPSNLVPATSPAVAPDRRLFELFLKCHPSRYPESIVIVNSINAAEALPFFEFAARNPSIQIITLLSHREHLEELACQTILAKPVVHVLVASEDSLVPDHSLHLLANPRDPLRTSDNPHIEPLLSSPIFGFALPTRISPALPARPYRDLAYFPKKLKHWGQRKLLMNEIQFLVRHGHRSDLVVYAGAAPGTHVAVLMRMFPRHVFHLWDPAPFNQRLVQLSTTGRIFFYNDYFTDQTAESYANRNVLFICDIRAFSSNPNELELNERETDIIENMAMQKRWCMLMKPAMCILKFRMPWVVDESFRKKVSYFAGEINLQPWAPRYSTELRLITDCLSEAEYDPTDIEGQCFFINSILRKGTFPRSKEAVEECPIGHCCCYDCSLELEIMREFCSYMDSPEDHQDAAHGQVNPEQTQVNAAHGQGNAEQTQVNAAHGQGNAEQAQGNAEQAQGGGEESRVGKPLAAIVGHPEGMSFGERMLYWQFEIRQCLLGGSVFTIHDRELHRKQVVERQSKGKHALPWFSPKKTGGSEWYKMNKAIDGWTDAPGGSGHGVRRRAT